MRINKPYTNQDYARLAAYCNANNCHIEDKGDYLEAVENVAPVLTKEQIEQARADLYCSEVDPITCHINRLKDEEQTPEVIAEIASLVEERKAKVEEIKARYPYPVEPIEEIEELPVVEEAVVSEVENTIEEII